MRLRRRKSERKSSQKVSIKCLIGNSYTAIPDESYGETLTDVHSKKEKEKRKFEAEIAAIADQVMVVDANLDGGSFISKPMHLFHEWIVRKEKEKTKT